MSNPRGFWDSYYYKYAHHQYLQHGRYLFCQPSGNHAKGCGEWFSARWQSFAGLGFMFDTGQSIISRKLGKGQRVLHADPPVFLFLHRNLHKGSGNFILTPFMKVLKYGYNPPFREHGFFILLAGPFMTGSCKKLNNILRYEGWRPHAAIGLDHRRYPESAYQI